MNKKTTLIIGACVVVLAIALVIILPRGGDPGDSAEAPSGNENEHEPMRASSPEEEELALEESELDPEELEPEPIHYSEDGFDPHDQPIGHLVREYRPGELPDGYTMHNVSVTEKGLTLDPAPPGHEGPRVGMVESPPIHGDFPFNGIAPQWMEELPEGTSMLVELQFSPDGENWTNWYQTEVDHTLVGQVREYMPDGTPNEGYGYTPGNLSVWGGMLWTQFRYNIAFYSESDESPSLSSHRFFMMDSTMGRGQIATPTDSGFENYDVDLTSGDALAPEGGLEADQ